MRSRTNDRNHMMKFHPDQYSITNRRQTKLKHFGFDAKPTINGSKRTSSGTEFPPADNISESKDHRLEHRS